MTRLAATGASIAIVGSALAVTSALALGGAQGHDLAQFLAWVALFVTLAGLGIQGAVVLAEGDKPATLRYTVKTSGLSVIIMILGFGLSLMAAPGLFTWFIVALAASMLTFAFANWNANRPRTEHTRTRRRR